MVSHLYFGRKFAFAVIRHRKRRLVLLRWLLGGRRSGNSQTRDMNEPLNLSGPINDLKEIARS
jgi:hypothetical protein